MNIQAIKYEDTKQWVNLWKRIPYFMMSRIPIADVVMKKIIKRTASDFRRLLT